MQDRLKYWVWLCSLPKVGPRRCLQLIEHFGEPENIWQLTEMELAKAPFVTSSIIRQLMDDNMRNEADKHYQRILENRINIITLKDDIYPLCLKNIHDPPTVLFVKGTLNKDEKVVGVVGSRKATPYGLSMAENLSYELAGCGVTVISGMARGIDSYAHNGALRACGRTVAVLGCGLDKPYPIENKYLMEKIMDSGAVISEYLPGTLPLPRNFPARNRIISGMSLGVVVIEAGEKSGSLITADFALEQGRDVFAVPGNISSFNSKGTNKLIKEGAKLVTCVEDVLEELKEIDNVKKNGFFDFKKAVKEKEYLQLDDDEKRIWSCLEDEPTHIDALLKKTGMSMNVINSLLVMMELKGIIEQIPGKIFKLRE